ncbi:MAG TPA: hypothetical protein DEG70_13665 [Chloroflexi bacterium]|nr:hypothetical protein [Chloroflexota bacterium]
MDRSTRGTLEVVGIATAAAAAIGGIVVALSRAQSAQNSDGESPNAVASVSSVTSNGGDRGSDAMATAMGSLAEVYPEILDSIRNLLTNAGEAARPAVDRAATSFPSATDVRATGASAISKLQHAALDTIVPAMSEVFQSARGRLELDHEPAEPAKSAEPAVGVVSATDAAARRAIDRTSQSAHAALAASGNVARESAAAALWLTLASALVFFLMLSDQQREKVTAAIGSAVEQAQTLIRDFKGYEDEY